MSKTQYLKFKGKVAWARVYEPDEFPEGNFNWKVNFFPDDIPALKKAGIQQQVRTDDGENSGLAGEYMVFRRPVEKEFRRGEVTKLLPPFIFDKTGKKLVWYVEDESGGFDQYGDPVLIGNGSEVEITLEVYNAGRMGKGARLNSLKIIDLIEYERPEEISEEEINQAVEAGTVKKSKVDW